VNLLPFCPWPSDIFYFESRRLGGDKPEIDLKALGQRLLLLVQDLTYSNFHLDKPQILVRAVREPPLALWLTHLKMAITLRV
jgi:hypothetical protein